MNKRVQRFLCRIGAHDWEVVSQQPGDSWSYRFCGRPDCSARAFWNSTVLHHMLFSWWSAPAWSLIAVLSWALIWVVGLQSPPLLGSSVAIAVLSSIISIDLILGKLHYTGEGPFRRWVSQM